MNRTDFYQKITATQGSDSIYELDPLVNSISELNLKYPVTYYRVRGEDDMKIFNISYRAYGDVSLWWVLLVVNDLDNPFLDLEPGIIIKIPNVLDIYDFQKKHRVRRNR